MSRRPGKQSAEATKNTKQLRRLKRKSQGLCQTCPRASKGRNYCALCAAKRLLKDAERLEQLHNGRAAMLGELYGGNRDRRRNGQYSKQLDWALVMHRHAHEPDYVVH